MPDYNRLRLDELSSISEFVEDLSDEQWDQASLCAGWRVRDVVSHMALGYTTPMFTMVKELAKFRFNVPRASAQASVDYGSEHSPSELKAVFASIHRDGVRKGISRIIPAREGMLDHVVHHQDMRRPLGKPRHIPEERLVAALGVAPTVSGFVGSKKRAAGLRLRATDVEWSHGDGPEVSGTGEALLLALTGRPVVLAELVGEGVAVLRDRVASS